MFLCFATKDASLVEAFRNGIERQHPNLELLDHAVTDSYDDDWKPACARKIDRSELLICLIGATTHRSQAVAWEISRALSLGKRIVAVNLDGEKVRIPEVLVRHGIEPGENVAGILVSSPFAPSPEPGAGHYE